MAGGQRARFWRHLPAVRADGRPWVDPLELCVALRDELGGTVDHRVLFESLDTHLRRQPPVATTSELLDAVIVELTDG